MDGSRVDLTALTHSSEGVRDTIDSMDRPRDNIDKIYNGAK